MPDNVLNIGFNLEKPTNANIKRVVDSVNAQLKGIAAKLNVKVDPQVTKETNNLGKSLNTVTKNSKSAASGMEEFGAKSALAFRRFSAYAVATTGVIRLTNAIRDAVSEAISFETQIIKVSQVSGIAVKDLKGLRNEIFSIATDFGVSATKIAESARTLSQAGFTVQEVEKALRGLAKTELAATFGDITETTEASIAILRQFNIQTTDLEKKLGSINAVASRFAVESEDITSAVRRAGGVFAAAGGDLEEFIGLFTAIRSTTRESAETIGTGLRTITTRLQRGSTQSFLKDLGIDLQDAEGQFVGAFEAFRRLSTALGQLNATDPRFAAIGEELGGFRQIGKVIPAIRQFETAQRALQVAQEGTNSLNEDSTIALQGLEFQLKRVREEFQQLIDAFSNNSTLRGIVDLFLRLTANVLQLANAIEPLIPVILTIAGAKVASGFTSFAKGALGTVSRNQGGLIPGRGPNKDTVVAGLTKGEFVIQRDAVDAIGVSTLEKINQLKPSQNFNSGGRVGYQSGGIVGGTTGGLLGVALVSNIIASQDDVAEGNKEIASGLADFASKLAVISLALDASRKPIEGFKRSIGITPQSQANPSSFRDIREFGTKNRPINIFESPSKPGSGVLDLAPAGSQGFISTTTGSQQPAGGNVVGSKPFEAGGALPQNKSEKDLRKSIEKLNNQIAKLNNEAANLNPNSFESQKRFSARANQISRATGRAKSQLLSAQRELEELQNPSPQSTPERQFIQPLESNRTARFRELQQARLRESLGPVSQIAANANRPPNFIQRQRRRFTNFVSQQSQLGSAFRQFAPALSGGALVAAGELADSFSDRINTDFLRQQGETGTLSALRTREVSGAGLRGAGAGVFFGAQLGGGPGAVIGGVAGAILGIATEFDVVSNVLKTFIPSLETATEKLEKLSTSRFLEDIENAQRNRGNQRFNSEREVQLNRLQTFGESASIGARLLSTRRSGAGAGTISALQEAFGRTNFSEELVEVARRAGISGSSAVSDTANLLGIDIDTFLNLLNDSGSSISQFSNEVSIASDQTQKFKDALANSLNSILETRGILAGFARGGRGIDAVGELVDRIGGGTSVGGTLARALEGGRTGTASRAEIDLIRNSGGSFNAANQRAAAAATVNTFLPTILRNAQRSGQLSEGQPDATIQRETSRLLQGQGFGRSFSGRFGNRIANLFRTEGGAGDGSPFLAQNFEETIDKIIQSNESLFRVQQAELDFRNKFNSQLGEIYKKRLDVENKNIDIGDRILDLRQEQASLNNNGNLTASQAERFRQSRLDNILNPAGIGARRTQDLVSTGINIQNRLATEEGAGNQNLIGQRDRVVRALELVANSTDKLTAINKSLSDAQQVRRSAEDIFLQGLTGNPGEQRRLGQSLSVANQLSQGNISQQQARRIDPQILREGLSLLDSGLFGDREETRRNALNGLGFNARTPEENALRGAANDEINRRIEAFEGLQQINLKNIEQLDGAIAELNKTFDQGLAIARQLSQIPDDIKFNGRVDVVVKGLSVLQDDEFKKALGNFVGKKIAQAMEKVNDETGTPTVDVTADEFLF